jgi:hypothetical protein
MTTRTTIQLLAAACVAEAVVIGFLVSAKPIAPVALSPSESAVVGPKKAGTDDSQAVAAAAIQIAMAQIDLTKKNAVLETGLAEVTQELDKRKSEISFSYGSVRDSGRFVGMTFRKMFETAAAKEAAEAQTRAADNQINILSLGPFIQDAEVMESDPDIFAQFQTPLISEMLGLPAERTAEVEALLSDMKAKSMKVDMASPEWAKLNDTALSKIIALVPDEQKPALKGQISFFQQYGVLMIPAYAILRSPAPTVVPPSGEP